MKRFEKLKEMKKQSNIDKGILTKNQNPGFSQDMFSDTQYYFHNGKGPVNIYWGLEPVLFKFSV